MAVVLKSSKEIEKMRRAGQVVREVLELVRGLIKPGATTLDLEKAAEARTKALGAKPAFKGYHGYPCVLCTSVNSEVVHGIPSSKRVLKEGEIVSVDFGAFVDGYCGDAAITVPVGEKIDAKMENKYAHKIHECFVEADYRRVDGQPVMRKGRPSRDVLLAKAVVSTD